MYKDNLFDIAGNTVHLLSPLAPTPIDGQWSTWFSWSACSQECYGQGRGIKRRHRNCTSPAPTFGGQRCSGHSSEDQYCLNNCPGKFWKCKIINYGQDTEKIMIISPLLVSFIVVVVSVVVFILFAGVVGVAFFFFSFFLAVLFDSSLR